MDGMKKLFHQSWGYRHSYCVSLALTPIFSCLSHIDLFYGLSFAITLSHPRSQKTPVFSPLRNLPDSQVSLYSSRSFPILRPRLFLRGASRTFAGTRIIRPQVITTIQQSTQRLVKMRCSFSTQVLATLAIGQAAAT